MKEKRQDSLSPNLRKYYEARQEMNDWLEKDDLPEDTKATMYAQQLQRVNQLKNQVFRPEPSPVQMITHTEQTMTSESDSTTPSQQLNATDKQIIDSVPKTMQNRAKLLLQKLKDHSDVILYVKKIELTPSVFNAINTVLNDKNAQYAIRELHLKYLQFQEDSKVNT